MTCLRLPLVALLLAACSGGPVTEASSIRGETPVDALPRDAGPIEAHPPFVACTPLAPRIAPIEVAALPEAGEAPYVSAIASAKTSVRVMAYLMGYGGVLSALEDKARAGVNVRVILDSSEKGTNQKYFSSLTKAGASVIWSDSQFPYMHAKVLVVDDSVAVISTGNYAKAFLLKGRDFAATDRDPEDVQNLVGLFESDWGRASPDLSCTRLLVAPVNARKRLLDFIGSAKSEILVESMQLSDHAARDALLARKKAGVSVRLILADPSWVEANTKAAEPLKEAGIDIRWLKEPAIHVKAIVIDHQAAYMGSENFSHTSLSKNREVGLLVDEVKNIDLMARTFETDWAIATKF
jgi:phosphatidylserine/phosphatidylglycerophosphate/cardiolipin synthase-like enzyme